MEIVFDNSFDGNDRNNIVFHHADYFGHVKNRSV